MRKFSSLSEREILALAIGLEEEDARIYANFADALKDTAPTQAEAFRKVRAQEDGHRSRLLTLYREKFGDEIPYLRRQDVSGFVSRRPVWLVRPLGLKAVLSTSASMEKETCAFYEAAIKKTTDAGIRQLLGDLAAEEREHVHAAHDIQHLPCDAGEEDARKQLFILRVIQPGLAGLMDGSVSTLAPLFAAAAATHSSHDAFLVGMAASLGAGISMGFAEALSDDGSITGRGHPWVRGGVCGLMTALGGIGHTLPFLISDIHVATIVAVVVVIIELGVIAWIRRRFMDTPLMSAVFQVVVGGARVFAVGALLGSA